MRSLVLAISFGITGCSLAPEIDSNVKKNNPRSFPWLSAHEVTIQPESPDYRDTPLFLGCYNTIGKHEFTKYSSSRDKDLRLARQAFKYALMASNAYHAEANFQITGWKALRHYRGAASGFQADLYLNENTKSIAVAFRGTDNTNDGTANYSLWFSSSGKRAPQQYQLAANLITELRSEFNDHKLILTGHSLGAALAAYAGWTLSEAEIYLFDPSPRTWRGGSPASPKFFVLRESGEIINNYLFFWKQIPVVEENTAEYDSIAGLPTREHNMYPSFRT